MSAGHAVPNQRKGDPRGVEIPRAGDRRAASGCLWDACAAILASQADEQALVRALDSLRARSTATASRCT